MSYTQFILELNSDPKPHGIMFQLPKVGTAFRIRRWNKTALYGVVVASKNPLKHSFMAMVSEKKGGAGALRQLKLRQTMLQPHGCVRQLVDHPSLSINDIDWHFVHPDHRENEEWTRDPIFDVTPDDPGTSPQDIPIVDIWGKKMKASNRDRIDFEDLYKLGGRVIGRHEALVDIPFYLTVEFMTKKIQCTTQESSDLLDSLKVLDANEEMVVEAIEYAKSSSISDAIVYYDFLAEQIAALEPKTEDALNNAERLLNDDTGYNEDNEDDEDEEDDEFGEDDDEKDVVGFVSEGWHLMDDQDNDSETWLDKQSHEYVKIYLKAENAKNLSELKDIGSQFYAIKELTSMQRSAFWAVWKANRCKILSFNMKHIAKIRKAVKKIQSINLKELPIVGSKLYNLSKSEPKFYTEEGWFIIWSAYKQEKARVSILEEPNQESQTKPQNLTVTCRNCGELCADIGHRFSDWDVCSFCYRD